jgi:hypothetical protein
MTGNAVMLSASSHMHLDLDPLRRCPTGRCQTLDSLEKPPVPCFAFRHQNAVGKFDVTAIPSYNVQALRE